MILKKLTQNNNDESALEDLELASSSLKSHAMKFGFEKLSKLPHTIEDIAIESMGQKSEVPTKILHTIAEAVILLQTFVDDAISREKYKTILYKLNQYLKKIEKVKKAHELIHH